MKKPAAAPARIEVGETGPESFTLAVTVDGQRFECGRYLNRAAALQAGRLFVQRKEAEAVGQKRQPRAKR
ncbi:MAG: hypothetical protein WCO00_11805 [Rhodospirillaceae bacterium]